MPPANPPSGSPGDQQTLDRPSGPGPSEAAPAAAFEAPVSQAAPAPPPAGGWRESAAAAFALLLLLCLGYGNVIFAGASVVYSNNQNPMEDRPSPHSYGPERLPPEVWAKRNLQRSANFHDPGATWWQWEPGGEFLRSAIALGEWPWWDPYTGAGAPAMANMTQSFFFPPYLLMVALGNTVVLRNAYALLMLLVAASCTFALLRRHGLAPAAALAGAAAMLFCGGLNQNVGSFIGQTAACLPPALLLTRLFFERPSWRRTAWLALGYATVALASFPPLLLAVFGVCALYALAVIAASPDWRRSGARYLMALALAGGLVSFYYLPALAASRGLPQVERTYDGAGEQTIPSPSLAHLLSPVLTGAGNVHADPVMHDIGPMRIPYVGVVVLFLAALAAPPADRWGRLLFWITAAAALVAAMKLVGVPPIQQLGRLPVLDSIHFAHYFAIPLGMMLALLAGFGVNRLAEKEVSPLRLAAAGSLLGAIVLGLPEMALMRGAFRHPAAAGWLGRWYLLVAFFLAALMVAALAQRRRRRAGRGLLAALVVLLAVEGAVNTFYPRQRRWDVWRNPPPHVQQLIARSGEGRVLVSGSFSGNIASAFGFYGLDSLMTFNSPRAFELYRRYLAPNAYLFLREASLLPPESVLDAANIASLSFRESKAALIAEARGRGHREIYRDEYARIFERATEARYFFTSQFRVMPAQEALAALALPRQPREILLEDPAGVPIAPNQRSDAPVVVEKLGRNKVELKVRADRPGFVYCSETHARGWLATVNGRPAPVVPANYAFRAIPVPAGESVVALRYTPPGLRLGLALGAFSLTSLVALVWAGAREQRRPVAVPSVATLAPRWRRGFAGALWLGALWGALGIGAEVRRDLGAKLSDTGAPAAGAAGLLAPRGNSFYRVRWELPVLPSRLEAGTTVPALVAFANAGTGVWPDPRTADPVRASGEGAVRLSYRWWRTDGDEILEDYQQRIDLPAPLEPGRRVQLPVELRLPPRPGKYRLQLDLVHELVGWFELRGAEVLMVPVIVETRVEDQPGAGEKR